MNPTLTADQSCVTDITGQGVPLVGNDIDTDRIIPARFLRCVTFDGLGASVFADDRTSGGHPFDQADYQGATILVVNRNFGCGSSREHAPQALAKWGIKAIIGESFAEIFFGNCVAMGLPCVTANEETVQVLQQLLTQDPAASITIDLTDLQVKTKDFTAPLFMNEGARQMFVTGVWDACGQLVAQTENIRLTATNLPYMHW